MLILIVIVIVIACRAVASREGGSSNPTMRPTTLIAPLHAARTTQRIVAQVSKPAVSPISKSAVARPRTSRRFGNPRYGRAAARPGRAGALPYHRWPRCKPPSFRNGGRGANRPPAMPYFFLFPFSFLIPTCGRPWHSRHSWHSWHSRRSWHYSVFGLSPVTFWISPSASGVKSPIIAMKSISAQRWARCRIYGTGLDGSCFR